MQSGINFSSKALTCTDLSCRCPDCMSHVRNTGTGCMAYVCNTSTECMPHVCNTSTDCKPHVNLENCYGIAGRLISRTGAVFLIIGTSGGCLCRYVAEASFNHILMHDWSFVAPGRVMHPWCPCRKLTCDLTCKTATACARE